VVYVVNFEQDNPTALIGPMITKMTELQVAENSMPHLSFVTMPPSTFNYDPVQVREAIYAEDAWAAIVINANATNLL
jgi:hypothetical protein